MCLIRKLNGLRPVIASLSAVQAVVLTVAAEPHLVKTLTDGAVLVTLTAFFNQVANHAFESFSHERTITRNSRLEKRELKQRP